MNLIDRIIELEDEIEVCRFQLSQGAPTGTAEKKEKLIEELNALSKIRRNTPPPLSKRHKKS